jgi:DNA-binding NarL/FixJ family response regulator
MPITSATARARRSPTQSVRVLTIDDQPLFREAARALIAATGGFESIAEVPCGEDAVALAGGLRPDLVLVDAGLPGIDGLETSRRLAAASPESLVVLMSADDDPVLRAAVGSGGVNAFLPKPELSPSALRAVWEHHRGITPPG